MIQRNFIFIGLTILYLFSCKKNKEQTPTTNTSQNTNTVIKQFRVKAVFDSTPGQLFIYWNKGNGYVIDTLPQTPAVTTFDLERSGSYLSGDSAGIKWLSAPCPTCTPISAKITVTVSNNVTYTYNAVNSNFKYYKFQ